MCDMDCGSDGGFDVVSDSDVSEGTDFESDSAIDAGSSFEGMDDVTEAEEFESDVESFDADMEADSINTDMGYGDEYEYYSLDEFDDVEDVDNLSQDIYEVDETTESESKLDDEISEIDREMLGESESKTEDELMVELSQLDAVEPEMMDAAYLEELERANADNQEFLDGINRLIDEGKINVVDSSEITDEITGEKDAVKVLTREVTDEVLESRERDTNVVLENYRENLEARGVPEEQISEFLEQERIKINAEYERLDRNDTSSNIYDVPSAWDTIADTLMSQETDELDDDLEDVSEESALENKALSLSDLPDIGEKLDSTEVADDLEVDEESDRFENNPEDKTAFLLGTNELTEETERTGRFITDFPEEIEDTELPAEYMIEMPEMITNEELQESTEDIMSEEQIDEIVAIPNMVEGLSESNDIISETEEAEIQEELYENEQEISTELFENAVNYEEIYEEIASEALELGYKDIDIEANTEVLEQSLERFEEDTWENLEIYEQREAINELSDYIKDIIGFENPPAIEYYNSAREGEYGGYDSATNTLHINEYMLYNSREAADTIAHELWHAHQQECALNPKNPRDYQYQYNFDNYISPEYGFEQYRNQLVEAEARSFAAQFRDRIGNGKERTR